jgi:hypothetical protein
MTDKQIEFGSLLVIKVEDDTAIVGGRVTVGPINPGDLFSAAYRLGPPKVNEEGETYRPRRWERQIALIVDRIDSYGHSAAELEEGLSGRLELKGDGVDKLMENDILGLFTVEVSAEAEPGPL